MVENASGIIKFAIGVTGHRDCAEGALPRLQESVAHSLVELKNKFSELPVELVCGLAEGADSLVAQIALDLDIPVLAVLPMPLDLYKKDFSAAGLKVLEELVANPKVEICEIPMSSEEGADRDTQYVLLKDYIVRRSNVLLALWDDKVTGLPGGTSDVVLEYLSEDCAAEYQVSETNVSKTFRSASDDDDGNLVLSIHTPRANHPESEGSTTITYLMSEGAPNALACFSEFPSKVLDRWHGLEKYAVDRKSDYAADIHSWDLQAEGDGDQDRILPNLNSEFVRADQLAMANQKFSDMLFKGFALSAGAMGFFFLVYAKLSANKLFLVAYLILFASGYVLFRLSRSRGWFGKHLAYRALAEALRIRYFLILSGISGGVNSGRILKVTRINRFKGIEWLYDVIRCSEPILAYRDTSGGLEVVRKRWIDDQSGYFTKKVHTLHRDHARLEKIKTVLFFSSFIGVVALIFFKYELYKMHFLSFDGKILLVFMMGLLPLWLALWELYQSKMAVRELSWQYANQQRIFAEASRRMSEQLDANADRAVVLGLAESSLTEIFQWTAQRFHREHEPPSAG